MLFIDIMLFAMVTAPIPALYTCITRRVRPYRAIGAGIISAAAAILVVFLVSYLTGHSMGAQMDKAIDEAVDIIVNNKEILSTIGAADMSQAQAISALKEMYATLASMLPSVLIVMSAVVSYIEYAIIVRVRYAGSGGYVPYAYMRNFSLRNTDVIGWFVIYLAGYLLKFAGFGPAEAMLLNIGVLVDNIISLQAVSLIFFVTYVRRRPKIFAVLLTVALWMLPGGRTILMMLGLMDLLLNIRGRMREGYTK